MNVPEAYNNEVERKQTHISLLLKDEQVTLEKTRLLKKQTGFHHRSVLDEAPIGVPGTLISWDSKIKSHGGRD